MEFSLNEYHFQQMAAWEVFISLYDNLPKSGICSDVMGIFSETLSWKTVSDRRTVTPTNIPIYIFLSRTDLSYIYISPYF